MKKLMLIITFWAAAIPLTFSQNYHSFEWDILGISRFMHKSPNVGGALGLYTAARFNFNNRISVGLKYDWQFFGDLFEEPIRSAGITTSFSLTGDYYVNNKLNRRVFTGLAIGSFDNKATTESGIDVGGIGFGIIPRIGYEFEFIRITTEYNYTFRADFPNYLGIGIGLNIGGRYK